MQNSDGTIGDRNKDDRDSLTNLIKTFYAGIAEHNPGYLLRASIPGNYMDAYHIKEFIINIRARINQLPGGNSSDTVAIIHFSEVNDAGDVLPETKYGNQFCDQQPVDSTLYRRAYLDSIAIIASRFNNGNGYIDIKQAFSKQHEWETQKIDIFWTKKRDLYIDNISVYDLNYDSLFVAPTSVRTEIENRLTLQFYTKFGALQFNPLWAHLYHDEPRPLSNRAVKKLSNIAVTYLGTGKYINGANYLMNNVDLGIIHSMRAMPYVMYDHYPFIGGLDSASSGSNNVQDQIDALVDQHWTSGGSEYNCGIRSMIQLAQNYTPADPSDDVPFYHTLQTCAEKTVNAGSIVSVQHREPQPNEILVQGWLAMCYGAKGLMYYTIATNTPSPYSYSDVGGIYGLFDSQGQINYPCQNPVLNQIPNARYYAVQKLNGQIDKISSELMQLTWVDAFSAHQGIPSGKYVTDVSYPHAPSDTKYIEVGFFKKSTEMNNDNLEYLMVVNRRVLSTETDSITIQINKANSPYNNWKVTEVGNNSPYAYITRAGSFTYSFPPGEGRLFRLEPVLLAGGSLFYNDTITAAYNSNLPSNLEVKAGAALTIASGVNLNFPSVGSFLSVKGDLVLKSNLTIPSNSTLRIISTSTSAPTLKIDANTSLTVQGTLSVSGNPTHKVLIDRTGSSGYFNYITFDSSYTNPSAGYSNELTHCIIKHSAGIKILNSDVGVYFSKIDSCVQGIYIENSSPLIYADSIRPINNAVYGSGLASPNIWDNVFFKDGEGYHTCLGVFLISYMCPWVSHNKISGFDIGMYFGGTAEASFLDGNGLYPYPNNQMGDNDYGLMVGWGSFCGAGDESGNGYNTIAGNGTELYCYMSSVLLADGNYFGGGDPSYYCDEDSYISYANVLDDDPWAPENMVKSSNNQTLIANPLKKVSKKDIATNIRAGYQLEKEGKIDAAIAHYKNMVKDGIAGNIALAKCVLLTRKYKKGDTKSYLAEVTASENNYSKQAASLLANITLQDGNYTESMKMYDKIIKDSPDSYEGISAKFEKLFAALHREKNSEKAAAILSELQQTPMKDKGLLTRLQIANDFVNGYSGDGKTSKKLLKIDATNTTPKEYRLLNNYPNPFNPSTTISYTLADVSNIEITIFDAMGKQVKVLRESNLSSGEYGTMWDGTNEYGTKVSSGIYLYHFKVQSVNGMNMVYQKSGKMVLVK